MSSFSFCPPQCPISFLADRSCLLIYYWFVELKKRTGQPYVEIYTYLGMHIHRHLSCIFLPTCLQRDTSIHIHIFFFFYLYTILGSFHNSSQEDLMPQYRQNHSLGQLQTLNTWGNVTCGILFIYLLILASLYPEVAGLGRQTLSCVPSLANVLVLCPQVECAPPGTPIPHLPTSPSCSTGLPVVTQVTLVIGD